ncbi:glycosyltransferase family 4 protein [Thermostichus vulcanus]|uniref:Glycosyltransferase family 4 protein n=1 Tax=Thermostichus vulcanus str. 'Rupite' TaxID=2813851 RepID=A0ABT0CD94_THEVL|nr:glycosyltransferase family 4 protein [Thermostichus vulcanus]MCJ2543751.1 glycosyltransferase family 4 protein [Thermostichus vulcanus str. 'Rupite']
MTQPRRYLFLSTPVGPLGSGAGGGVELNLANLTRTLMARGYQMRVLAPQGSCIAGLPPTVIEPVAGLPPRYAQSQRRDAPVQIDTPSLLAHLWQRAAQMQDDFDLIVNWSYDWLSFYLTDFFRTPVAHIISMGSLNNAVDQALEHIAQTYPDRLAVHSRAQGQTFAFAQAGMLEGRDPFVYLPCGVDLQQYDFVPHGKGSLAWVGRIAPEKGLEDCAALSEKTGIPVVILGHLQDPAYWQQIQANYPQAQLDYRGFLPTRHMQQILGQCSALVMTPKWIEAFGMVAVEALACGVPVITYRRGGPAEIVRDGETGWVVDPDDVPALVDAVGRLDRIDRHHCRQRAEQHYSLNVMAERFLAWDRQICRDPV